MGTTVYVCRVAIRGATRRVGIRWCIFDGVHRMIGFSGESRLSLLLRWGNAFEPPSKVIRYTETMSEAELAATIADLMIERETT